MKNIVELREVLLMHDFKYPGGSPNEKEIESALYLIQSYKKQWELEAQYKIIHMLREDGGYGGYNAIEWEQAVITRHHWLENSLAELKSPKESKS